MRSIQADMTNFRGQVPTGRFYRRTGIWSRMHDGLNTASSHLELGLTLSLSMIWYAALISLTSSP
jgi:hypothetical protein